MKNDGPQVAPLCNYCNDAVLTVKHMLLNCPALLREMQRLSIFRKSNNVSVMELLGDGAPLKDVIAMLRRIGVYDRIGRGNSFERLVDEEETFLKGSSIRCHQLFHMSSTSDCGGTLACDLQGTSTSEVTTSSDGVATYRHHNLLLLQRPRRKNSIVTTTVPSLPHYRNSNSIVTTIVSSLQQYLLHDNSILVTTTVSYSL